MFMVIPDPSVPHAALSPGMKDLHHIVDFHDAYCSAMRSTVSVYYMWCEYRSTIIVYYMWRKYCSTISVYYMWCKYCSTISVYYMWRKYCSTISVYYMCMKLDFREFSAIP